MFVGIPTSRILSWDKSERKGKKGKRRENEEGNMRNRGLAKREEKGNGSGKRKRNRKGWMMTPAHTVSRTKGKVNTIRQIIARASYCLLDGVAVCT